MQLNDLKPAWNQLKLISALQPVEPNEILSIIEGPQSNLKTKLQRVALNLVILIVITVCCQGG